MESKEIIVKHPGKTIIDRDKDKITIIGKSALNFVNQGIKRTKIIFLKSITSIQFKSYD